MAKRIITPMVYIHRIYDNFVVTAFKVMAKIRSNWMSIVMQCFLWLKFIIIFIYSFISNLIQILYAIKYLEWISESVRLILHRSLTILLKAIALYKLLIFGKYITYQHIESYDYIFFLVWIINNNTLNHTISRIHPDE